MFNAMYDVKPVMKNAALKYQVNKGQYKDFNDHLKNVNLETESDDIDVLWETIDLELKMGVDKFIPKKLIKPGSKKRSCPSTPGLLHKVHLKRVAFKTYKKYPSTKNYKIYCKYRNQVKWETRKSVRMKEGKIAKILKVTLNSSFNMFLQR